MEKEEDKATQEYKSYNAQYLPEGISPISILFQQQISAHHKKQRDRDARDS
jgi:hypothetical protein